MTLPHPHHSYGFTDILFSRTATRLCSCCHSNSCTSTSTAQGSTRVCYHDYSYMDVFNCYHSDILVFLTGQEEIESCQRILLKCNNELPTSECVIYPHTSLLCYSTRLPEDECVQIICSPAHFTTTESVCS